MREITGQLERRSPTTSDLFYVALLRLTIVWFATASVVAIGLAMFLPRLLGPANLIAVSSGLISLLALAPGVVSRGAPKRDEDDAVQHDAYRFLLAFLVAMAIRVAGTVALLVVCRYQMDVPIQTIAIFICGWYVWLTFVEVGLLAIRASEMNTFSESTLG